MYTKAATKNLKMLEVSDTGMSPGALATAAEAGQHRLHRSRSSMMFEIKDNDVAVMCASDAAAHGSTEPCSYLQESLSAQRSQAQRTARGAAMRLDSTASASVRHSASAPDPSGAPIRAQDVPRMFGRP